MTIQPDHFKSPDRVYTSEVRGYSLPMVSGSWVPLVSIVHSTRRQHSDKSIVYCVRNVRNDKRYVGKTVGTLRSRVLGHVYEAFVKDSTYVFHCALRKHGLAAFEACVLEQGPESSLFGWEISHIARLGSFGAGYNATKGGEGLWGFHHKLRTKQLISLLKKGVPMPVEQRLKLQKPVQQLDLQTLGVITTFESVTQALQQTGVNNIGKCCTGELRQAGGFLWRFVDADDLDRVRWSDKKRVEMKQRLQQHNPLDRSVEQLDLRGTVIARYPSVKTAHEATQVTNIALVCRGGRKSAGGFSWRYTLSAPTVA